MTQISGLGAFGASRLSQGAAAGAVEPAAAGASAETRKAEGRQDSASLSARGRVMAEVSRAVSQSSDVRADRVAALKAAIANGSYVPDAGVVAARLAATGAFGES